MILNMGVSKTNDYILIMIKIPNPSLENPASPKTQNEDIKDMDVLCTFKIKIDSQNLEHRGRRVHLTDWDWDSIPSGIGLPCFA